jgi:SAM-dependent methyltransferase
MTDTLFRWDIINALLGTTAQKRFLEIGVQRGICGSKVRAKTKVGVDPNPIPPAGRHYTQLYRAPSDNFFVDIAPDTRFDVVLVDGLHHADQVLRDVDNALRHLSDDGVIVLHDCNPQSEAAQRVPREVGVWNGDCWRAMVALRQRPDLDCFTVDTDHGVGIVRRRPNPNPLPAVGELSYAALTRDRRGLLNLVSPRAWEERLGGPLASDG